MLGCSHFQCGDACFTFNWKWISLQWKTLSQIFQQWPYFQNCYFHSARSFFSSVLLKRGLVCKIEILEVLIIELRDEEYCKAHPSPSSSSSWLTELVLFSINPVSHPPTHLSRILSSLDLNRSDREGFWNLTFNQIDTAQELFVHTIAYVDDKRVTSLSIY